MTLTCPSDPVSSTVGDKCFDNLVSGQSTKLGVRLVNGEPFFFGNPAAFSQPAPCTALPCPLSSIGGHPTQISGPGFKRMDFSAFKDIHLNERFMMQFRAEVFNLFNHPNFNAPGFGGNGVVAVSGATDFRNPTLRPATDPVRFEVLLLSSFFTSEGAPKGCLLILFLNANTAGSLTAVLAYERCDLLSAFHCRFRVCPCMWLRICGWVAPAAAGWSRSRHARRPRARSPISGSFCRLQRRPLRRRCRPT